MQRYKFFVDEKNKDYVYQYINKINPEYREQYMRDFVIYDVEKIDNDTLYYMDIINASHLEKNYRVQNTICSGKNKLFCYVKSIVQVAQSVDISFF